MLNLLFIALGGAIGSVARYGLGAGARNLWPGHVWPWGTFAANVLGGLLMGVLMGLLWGPLKGSGDAERLRLTLGVGVLGGFTTFSTFSLEAVQMIERRAYGLACAYMLASVAAAIAALMLGLMIVRRLTS